ncbi:hypothetical protein V6N13_046348 [Hibiscus sabdariffa]
MDGGEAGEDADVSVELAVVLNDERVVALFDNDDTTGPEIEGYCQEDLVTNCLGDEELVLHLFLGGNEKELIYELVVVLNEERVVALYDNDDTTGPEIEGYCQENLATNCLGDEELELDKLPDVWGFVQPNGFHYGVSFVGHLGPRMMYACNEKEVIYELVVVVNEERVVALFDNDDTTDPEIESYCQENLVTNCLVDDEVLGVRGDKFPDKNQNLKEEIFKAIRIEEEFISGILMDPLMDED